MKYLEDLIKEASEINERFEESKELILAISDANKLEGIVYKEMVKKYDLVITTILILEDFLHELTVCEDDEEVASLLIRAKS